MNVGPLEIVILVVVVLLVFGARKLPELGSSLGQSIRGFGKGISGEADEEPARVEEAAPPEQGGRSEAPPAAAEPDPPVSAERRAG